MKFIIIFLVMILTFLGIVVILEIVDVPFSGTVASKYVVPEHVVSGTNMILVGKVLVPHRYTRTVPTEYFVNLSNSTTRDSRKIEVSLNEYNNIKIGSEMTIRRRSL